MFLIINTWVDKIIGQRISSNTTDDRFGYIINFK